VAEAAVLHAVQGRAVTDLAHAAWAVGHAWERGDQERAGWEIARMRAVLARVCSLLPVQPGPPASPAHRIELRGKQRDGTLNRVRRAVLAARDDGEATVVTVDGQRAALIIPAAAARRRSKAPMSG